MGANTSRLLRRIGMRWQLASVGGRFHKLFLGAAGAYALLLLASRLTAVVPNRFAPVQLGGLAAAALALAIAIRRRPSPTETARLLDARSRGDDLFLTTCLIDTSGGQYQPLVVRQAEERSRSIAPKAIVPYLWRTGALHVAAALAILVAGMLFLPQLDPFGRGRERKRVDELRQSLAQARTATSLRKDQLAQVAKEGELSTEVASAIEGLKNAFRATAPSDRQGNLKRLGEHQQELGQLWRQAAERKLKNAFGASEDQGFGAQRSERAGVWGRELAKGETTTLREDVARLKEAAARLAALPEGEQKRQLAEDMKRTLQEMAEFAAGEMKCDSLSCAQRRALEQLAMAGAQGLSKEALQALQESLELSELELESFAQSLSDLEALEDALKALQMAKSLNEMDLLDGEQSSQCEAMADYVALYAGLLSGRCTACGGQLGADGVCPGCGGVGPGMGGPGTGVGGSAQEDETLETDFRPVQSRSALSAGKMLLTITTRGLTDPGEAAGQYQRYAEEVRQGVSEAILHEEVPPAYHEAVRNYFDTIGRPDEESTAQ